MASSSSSSSFLDVESCTLSSHPEYFSRRHTYTASMRPLRSSPLAGPSLALSHEGVLVGPATDDDESASISMSSWSASMSSSACTSSTGSTSEHGVPSRYRPSRMASSPPLASSSYSASAPSSVRFLQPPPVVEDEPPSLSLSPSPSPSPTPNKAARSISLGRMTLKSMPSLFPSAPSTIPTQPERPPAAPTSPPTPGPGPSAPRPRSILISPAASTHSLASTHRTPSVSSVSSASASAAPRRRSYFADAPPSTSRDPELNWMSASGPPRFSRTGLTDGSVVLPVSARAARRSSLPPAPYSPAGAARARRQTLGPGHPLAAAAAVRARVPAVRVPSASPELAPPAAPFRDDSPGSSTSSLGSERAGSSTSLSTLSRTASEASAASGKGCVGVIVQVNGTPVEVVGLAPAAGGEAQRKSRGAGTIRRVWRRVVRSVSGGGR